MKALLASTALVVASLPALAEDALIVVEDEAQEVRPTDETGRAGDLADPDETRETNAGRTEGARAVSQEGSGMTTQSSAATVTARGGAPVTPRNDGIPEGTTTNVPSLEDGVIVDDPRTPATARIVDGEVETRMDGDARTVASNPQTTGGSLAAPDVEVTVASPTFAAPTIEREGLTPLLTNTLSMPELEGVNVYDLADEQLGEIGYTVPEQASGLGHPLAILSMGGFLGIGDRDVALPMNALTFVRGDDGIRAYLDATEDQLDALPEYDG